MGGLRVIYDLPDVDGLPEVPGPKLYPFDTGGAPLDLELIEKIGWGRVSVVWKVRINGAEYALKIFNYFQPYVATYGVEFTEYEDEHEDAYFKPFNNECRAFGRLQEFNMAHFGVRCYGYITLSDAHVAFLRNQDDFGTWDYEPEYDENKPVRAIVKEILHIPPNPPWEGYLAAHVSPETVPKMHKGLKTMHRLGIMINDVNYENYIHGKFVDLGHAYTAPHPLLRRDKIPREFLPLTGAALDALQMDYFVDEWNDSFPHRWIWNRLLPNPYYTEALRHCSLRSVWGIRPERFTYMSAWIRYQGQLLQNLPCWAASCLQGLEEQVAKAGHCVREGDPQMSSINPNLFKGKAVEINRIYKGRPDKAKALFNDLLRNYNRDRLGIAKLLQEHENVNKVLSSYLESRVFTVLARSQGLDPIEEAAKAIKDPECSGLFVKEKF